MWNVQESDLDKTCTCKFSGSCQRLEQPNVERPTFRNFKISNIKWTKDEDFFIIFQYLFKLFEHLKFMIIYKIENLWNFHSFPNCKIFKLAFFRICKILEIFCNFSSWKFFGIFLIWNILEFFKFENVVILQIPNFSNIPNCEVSKFSN